MPLNHRDYNPDLMQGASETISDDLTVTDTLTVGGVTALNAATTVTGTLTATKLVIPAVSGAGAIGIDASAVLGSQRVLSFLATTLTPVAPSGTTVNTGWMAVDVSGTVRYIPFYK